MAIENGGPAFPQHVLNPNEKTFAIASSNGMSLRDYFAAATLTAYLSSTQAQEQLEIAIREVLGEDTTRDRRAVLREVLAKRAYLQADALLAERERTP